MSDIPDPPQPLPIPGLPEGKTLEPSDLANLPGIPQLDPEYNIPDGDGYKAIDYTKLSAGQWLSVANNTGMLRGVSFTNVDGYKSSNYVLLPKNRNLYPIFQRSSISEVYESRAVFKSNLSDTLAMSAVGASGELSSLWVSASASFESQRENRLVREKETLSTTTKYQLPIGRFDFSSSIRTYIDNGDEPGKPSYLFELNPDLVEAFTELLDDFDKLKEGAMDRFDLIDKVEQFFKDYGDVVALQLDFGLARYQTATVRSTSEQTLSKYEEQWKGAVNVAFLNAKITGSYDEATTYKTAGVEKLTSSGWITVAGSIPKDPKDPFTLINSRRDANSWSATEFGNYTPIVELLPKKLKARIRAYNNDMDFMSIFHNLDDNSQMQFEEGWERTLATGYISSVSAANTGKSYPYIGNDTLNGSSHIMSAPLVVGQRLRFKFILQKGASRYSLQLENQKYYHLHASTGKPLSLKYNPTPYEIQGDNNIFIIVPYRTKKGTDEKDVKYVLRNVATEQYVFIRNGPVTEPPADTWMV
jgi:hypothetical protein